MLKSRFPTKENTILLKLGGARVHSSYNKKDFEGMVKEMLPPR